MKSSHGTEEDSGTDGTTEESTKSPNHSSENPAVVGTGEIPHCSAAGVELIVLAFHHKSPENTVHFRLSTNKDQPAGGHGGVFDSSRAGFFPQDLVETKNGAKRTE
ncbi:Hypothetical protein SMAX5B_018460 [Scophthalmus maximus]|uniref:Uncharacterized protein n=1 Tax=Scophthalmus maximus TaxID=52904 RepID=A0A2U9C9Y3_SCOMX|nr:Hypothetical protein SMAX5B_018460 [Scophthalmus maximus]